MVALEDLEGETGCRVGRLLEVIPLRVTEGLEDAKAAHSLVAQSYKLKSYFLPHMI